MAEQARVTSTDVFESFRSSLIVFLSKARRSMDDVGDEVRRTRNWLQHDQRLHWEGEVRRRNKLLDQAQQELMSARLTGNRETGLMVRQAAVNKAKQALSEAEAKLLRVKKWIQNYDHCADPVVKRLESLRQFLDNDLPKATAYLHNVQKTLDQYAAAPSQQPGSSPLTSPSNEPPGETQA